MLQINPKMVARLDELEADPQVRRKRAAAEHWLGEIDGIDLTLTFLRAKRDEALRLSRRCPRTLRCGSGKLVVPRSTLWREALSTALLGDWCEPLWNTGRLSHNALGALKAEGRTMHQQLVPLHKRRTRHGRMLSLDADLGGLSLYDLIAPDVDLLARTEAGVYADERLNTVLRSLTEAERAVVFAYAEGEGTTWTEAAAAAGATNPDAFGQRVRRKAKRLAKEQARRAEQRQPPPPAASLVIPLHRATDNPF